MQRPMTRPSIGLEGQESSGSVSRLSPNKSSPATPNPTFSRVIGRRTGYTLQNYKDGAQSMKITVC